MFTLRVHYVKSVRIWSFSDPYFPTFGFNAEITTKSPYSVQMREDTDQKNSEYGHLLSSGYYMTKKNFSSRGNLKISYKEPLKNVLFCVCWLHFIRRFNFLFIPP